ncbi:rubredoxin [Anaerofustis sp.]|uniref:rubredoxin n=1 Tax=Anaerofustis sp. TaxID=1872517 RepID=UPI0025C4CC12|nr:rubredoxin [Anaerofustis sp.]
MDKYECTMCGYIYEEELGDPDSNIPPKTKWKDVPDTYVCPVCFVKKDAFEKIDL